MKIAFCSGASEPPFSSNHSFAYALREAGHDLVWVGPCYGDIDIADASIEDRPHPEYYSYKEIRERLPWDPDVLLVMEPHFYLGDPTGIPRRTHSVFYSLDPHRGAMTHVKAIDVGNYDLVLMAQYHYKSLLRDSTLCCILPQAFDARRFKFMDLGKDPVCDISFVGQTGIANMVYPHVDEYGAYATQPPDDLPTDHTRYAFHSSFTFDYAERAELLIRLCKDFSVRMYSGVYGDGFVGALQTGKVGFNRSLLSDFSIRPYEVMAAGRFAVTDDIFKDSSAVDKYLPDDDIPLFLYPTYPFKPFLPNFECEYIQASRDVAAALEYNLTDIGESAHKNIWENCSWSGRAKRFEYFMRTLLSIA